MRVRWPNYLTKYKPSVTDCLFVLSQLIASWIAHISASKTLQWSEKQIAFFKARHVDCTPAPTLPASFNPSASFGAGYSNHP